MKKECLVSVGLVALVVLIGGLLPPHYYAQVEPAAGDKEQAYQSLLAKLKGFDRSIDFKALRVAYSETSLYDPMGDWAREVGARRAILKALEDKDYEKALESAQALLAKNYLNIFAHSVCRFAYKQLNDLNQHEFHQFVENGLINSILSSGDGKSPETAYWVISLSEEYALFRYLGWRPTKQSLNHAHEHSYDRIEATNLQTGETEVVYFNVDTLFACYGKTRK